MREKQRLKPTPSPRSKRRPLKKRAAPSSFLNASPFLNSKFEFDPGRLSEALTDQNSILQSVFENMSDGVVVADKKGHLLVYNRALEKMLGLGLMDVPYQKWPESYGLYLSDQRTLYDVEKLPLVRAMRGESVDSIEIFVKNAKRLKGIWLSINARPIRSADGAILGGIAVCRDITAQKKYAAKYSLTEIALQDSELRFKSLVSNIPGAIYRCANDADWTMEFLSDAIHEITGYPASDFVKNRIRSFGSIIDPQDSDRVNEQVQKALRRKRFYTLEYRVKHKSGQIRWVYERGRAAYGKNGEVLWLDGAIFDITEEKEFKEKFQQSSQHLEKIINSVADPIFVKDRQHRWVLLNDACCRFMGYPREVLIGKSDYEFFPKEEADIFWEKDEEVFNSGRENLNEESFTDSKGIRHVIVTKKARYKDHLGHEYIVGTIRDVTDERQTQENLVQKTVELARINAEREYLELFAYVASHDLQEPLQKIIAFAGLLKSYTQKLDEKSRSCVDKMEHASQRMSGMIEDILRFTKVTIGTELFDMVDLNGVVREVLADLDMRISKTQAEINVGRLPPIRADRSQIYQLFLNLIVNALKFQNADTKPQIQIENAVPAAAGFVKISIKDNGIGFDDKYADKIFRPFERLHQRQYEGTGIGLAICKKIVTRHGGTITVSSKPGKGAAFLISLPLEAKVKIYHESA